MQTPRAQLQAHPALARRLATTWASVAFLLSVVYVYHYLGGAPRIIDATTYFLQSHLFAAGQFSLVPEAVASSYNGRFLLPTANGSFAPIFPPGYAAYLAIGVHFGQPMLMGPILAFLVALGTYELTASLFSPRAGVLACAMSALCSTLRYHTADTMSHGLCAALGCWSLALAMKNRAAWDFGSALLIGWLCATRPVTGLSFGLGTLVLLLNRSATTPTGNAVAQRLRSLPRHLLPWSGCFVGLGFLLIQQRAITGTWFASSQQRYYALSDGPPGCFNFGLGSEIGCQNEHRDFLQRYQPDGYGITQALGTTFRRLAMHASDALNSPISYPFLLVAVWMNRKLTFLWTILLLQVVLYAGFYFDGNYPGAGARMFSEVLPLEHCLLAGWLAPCRRAHACLVALPLGFLLWTRSAHESLSSQQGGSPMFQSSLINSGKEPRAELIYHNTDHGFNLAAAHHLVGGPIALRWRNDASDFWSHSMLSTPNAGIYRYSIAGEAPQLTQVIPQSNNALSIWSIWPPATLQHGWLEVLREPPSNCNRWGAWLAIHGTTKGKAVELKLPSGPKKDGPIELVLTTRNSSTAPFMKAPGGDFSIQSIDGACQKWQWRGVKDESWTMHLPDGAEVGQLEISSDNSHRRVPAPEAPSSP